LEHLLIRDGPIDGLNALLQSLHLSTHQTTSVPCATTLMRIVDKAARSST
jgi:hypothetical protein